MSEYNQRAWKGSEQGECGHDGLEQAASRRRHRVLFDKRPPIYRHCGGRRRPCRARRGPDSRSGHGQRQQRRVRLRVAAIISSPLAARGSISERSTGPFAGPRVDRSRASADSGGSYRKAQVLASLNHPHIGAIRVRDRERAKESGKDHRQRTELAFDRIQDDAKRL